MRRQPIVIDEDREPKYLNRYGITGAQVGLVAALGVTSGIAIATGGLSTISWPIVTGITGFLVGAGSGIGCIQGKEHVAKNKQEGKVVRAPSVLNEGLANGILNGSILTLGALTATALITGGGFGLAAGLVSLAGVAATGYLGYYQSQKHLDVMEVDYEQAKIKQNKRHGTVLDTLVNSVKKENTLTPEETARLNSRIKEGPEQKNWLENVTKREHTSPELGI